MLGRLRLGPHCLRGRRFPEPVHPFRNDFERDRDRITHARAFRRLEGKTQVFAAGLSDHFRNRLTHTIEVAQVARTVAVNLELNEHYTETLALAHDLGHPPFGHVGERELDRQMARFGESFEHNRHALRIVDHLEERYARFSGLNLTFEVREGIVKHSREVAADTADPELRELLPGLRPPLEAQLLDLADEIAYNTADIDDAFSVGLVRLDEIGEAVSVFGELDRQVDSQFQGLPPRVRFWEIQRQLLCMLIGGLIEATAEAANDAGVESVDDVRALGRRLACYTPAAAEANRQMKRLLIQRVYSSLPLAEDRRIAVGKMGEMFEYLLANPAQVSERYRERLEFDPVHRVVCDYIAGMTDTFFMKTYNALLGGGMLLA
ncbi:MAG TPA: dNTP triphosphohydrolase [Bryobacteraceae bacterium]|nr:dNTP triphosphohydrolase [Bryobacteraceae bacterium]